MSRYNSNSLSANTELEFSGTLYDLDKIKAQWAKQRPDLDTDPMELIWRLQRLSRYIMEEMITTIARHDLTFPGFDVLATLLRSGPPHSLTPNQLLDTMMITSGTMTNRIDQLEKQGLVKRVCNPEDKRSFMITLTKKGREVIDNAVTEHVETQTRLVSVLSTQEQIKLNNLLKEYFSRLESM